MNLLLRTTKTEMAEKGKSFHFTPNFCTEATLSFFQKKDGKRNEHLEFKVWHRDDKGGDAAGNNQESEPPWGTLDGAGQGELTACLWCLDTRLRVAVPAHFSLLLTALRHSSHWRSGSPTLPPSSCCSCALPPGWKQAFLQGGRSAQSSGRKHVAFAGLFSTSEPAEQF